MHDPFVIGHRLAPIGRGVADGVGGGIKGAGDGGLGTVHAGHVVGLQDDLFAYLIPGVLGFLDACWWWAAVWVVIVGLCIRSGGIGLRLVLGWGGFWGGLVVTGAGTAGQGQSPHCCAEGES